MAQQDAVNALDRQLTALRLRRAGVPYADIAKELGYAGRDGAHRAVKAALRKTLQEPADELRALELERLDALQMALWPRAQKGDKVAIDQVLKIMERRAKLLGLDAPAKHELGGAGGQPLTVQLNWGERERDDG